MDIVILGSGNIAFHLAAAFTENGVKIRQVFGRNEMDLSSVSEKTGIPVSTYKLEDADLYIIAVNDEAISDVSAKIIKEDCLVAHTAGSVSRETLNGSYRKSVFYPLQTFSKKIEMDYSEIPFFVDAENENDLKTLKNLAQKISGKVLEATDEKRKYIHLTAVFACNFVNHLYARAKEISDEQNIPFEFFLPLINETTKKINFIDPKDAQTGPAVRNDAKILQLQKKLITGEHLKIYETLSESIKNMYEL